MPVSPTLDSQQVGWHMGGWMGEVALGRCALCHSCCCACTDFLCMLARPRFTRPTCCAPPCLPPWDVAGCKVDDVAILALLAHLPRQQAAGGYTLTGQARMLPLLPPNGTWLLPVHAEARQAQPS